MRFQQFLLIFQCQNQSKSKWPKYNYWTIGVQHIFVSFYLFCADIDI